MSMSGRTPHHLWSVWKECNNVCVSGWKNVLFGVNGQKNAPSLMVSGTKNALHLCLKKDWPSGASLSEKCYLAISICGKKTAPMLFNWIRNAPAFVYEREKIPIIGGQWPMNALVLVKVGGRITQWWCPGLLYPWRKNTLASVSVGIRRLWCWCLWGERMLNVFGRKICPGFNVHGRKTALPCMVSVRTVLLVSGMKSALSIVSEGKEYSNIMGLRNPESVSVGRRIFWLWCL